MSERPETRRHSLAVIALFAAFATILAREAIAQQSTSATYGDWVVRCATQAGPPAQKVCDMEQQTRLQDQANPLSRISITRPTKDRPSSLVIQLPVNISLQTPVKIQTTDKDPGLDAPFERCVPGSCVAHLDLTDSVLKRFRSLTARGAVAFKDAIGREVSIPLSFNGFGAAYDALLNQ